MIMNATFGAGCFWCIEACFSTVNGILTVEPGYTGGSEETANYNAVCAGGTDHVEVAKISFDDEIISYEKLLELFWFVHDPTQVNRQGYDVGAHYRSAIFYYDSDQKKKAEKFKGNLELEKVWTKPIVTEIVPMGSFYAAEQYHKDYLKNNPENPYCQSIVRPKLDQFKKAFSGIMC